MRYAFVVCYCKLQNVKQGPYELCEIFLFGVPLGVVFAGVSLGVTCLCIIVCRLWLETTMSCGYRRSHIGYNVLLQRSLIKWINYPSPPHWHLSYVSLSCLSECKFFLMVRLDRSFSRGCSIFSTKMSILFEGDEPIMHIRSV